MFDSVWGQSIGSELGDKVYAKYAKAEIDEYGMGCWTLIFEMPCGKKNNV